MPSSVCKTTPTHGKMCVITDHFCLSESPPSHSFIHSSLHILIHLPAHPKVYLSAQSSNLCFSATCNTCMLHAYILMSSVHRISVSLLCALFQNTRSFMFDTVSAFLSNAWPLWGTNKAAPHSPHTLSPCFLSLLECSVCGSPLPWSPLWFSLPVTQDG